MGVLNGFYRAKHHGQAIAAASLWLCGVACSARALEFETVGARYGSPANRSAESFRQAEVFSDWEMPWRWQLSQDWQVQTRLDASAGWIGDSVADAFIGTVGPGFVWRWRQLPLHLDVGINPTVLSHVEFGRKDFGTPFQFSSHAGAELDLFSRVRLGYRFTHLSNAGLNRHNPGLNLHFVGVSYLF